MRRGFVYSLDAMLALFCAFFLVLLCFSQFSQVNFSDHETNRSLWLLSESGLTSAEKSGLLADAISQRDRTRLVQFVSDYPPFMCAAVQAVLPATDEVVLLAIKSGCEGQQGLSVRSQRLVPVWENHQYQYYVVTLDVWEAA